jgi:hypothetical protein
MIFLFNSQSYSYHISIGFAFSDCYVRSSQIGCRCQKFRFDVLLADLKMTTSSGISEAYCDIHHVSGMASFIGWCQSTSHKSHSLQPPGTCAYFWHLTLKFLIRWGSWSMFQSKSPCSQFLSPRKSEWEIFSANSRDCFFDEIVLIAIPKSYLDASHTKPWLFTTLN